MNSASYDYIIVGAGSAGCVLANRLSASGEHRVLLVEAGGRDDNRWVPIPLGMTRLIGDPHVAWLYPTAEKESLAGRSIMLTQGKMLGGSSSLNGNLYVRGQAADYDEWAQMGCEGWDWNSVLPYFTRSESLEQGGTEGAHGRDGELKLSWITDIHDTSRAVMQAAQASGLPWNEDINDGDQDGVGYLMGTIRDGRRQSTAVAFLHPAAGRPNLTVRTGARVRHVVFEGTRAVGVALSLADGSTAVERCGREVIVAAGTIGSPQVLQHSGIGDPEHLRSLDIPVVAESPEVGENLQDHLFGHLKLELRAGRMSMNALLGSTPRMAVEMLKWKTTGKGALVTTSAQLCCFFKSDQGQPRSNIQVAMRPFSIRFTPAGKLTTDDYPGINISAIQTRPYSRGRVRLGSATPGQAVTVDTCYLDDHRDVEALVAGMLQIRKILKQQPIAGMIRAEREPGPDTATPQALEDYLRRTASTVYHPVGTCRMGGDERSVVDPELRVRGVEGLRVIDASVMPRISSGNTNAPTIMIGEKGADLVLASS